MILCAALLALPLLVRPAAYARVPPLPRAAHAHDGIRAAYAHGKKERDTRTERAEVEATQALAWNDRGPFKLGTVDGGPDPTGMVQKTGAQSENVRRGGGGGGGGGGAPAAAAPAQPSTAILGPFANHPDIHRVTKFEDAQAALYGDQYLPLITEWQEKKKAETGATTLPHGGVPGRHRAESYASSNDDEGAASASQEHSSLVGNSLVSADARAQMRKSQRQQSSSRSWRLPSAAAS